MLALLDLIRGDTGIFSGVNRKDLMKLIFVVSRNMYDVDGNEKVLGIYININWIFIHILFVFQLNSTKVKFNWN